MLKLRFKPDWFTCYLPQTTQKLNWKITDLVSNSQVRVCNLAKHPGEAEVLPEHGCQAVSRSGWLGPTDWDGRKHANFCLWALLQRGGYRARYASTVRRVRTETHLSAGLSTQVAASRAPLEPSTRRARDFMVIRQGEHLALGLKWVGAGRMSGDVYALGVWGRARVEVRVSKVRGEELTDYFWEVKKSK